MLANCKFLECPKQKLKLQRRYAHQFNDLKREGFSYAGIMETDYSIAFFPFAAATGLMGREVMKFDVPRVSWFHPLFRSNDTETIAFPLGVATRFYSFFDDGTIQRTSSGVGSSRYVSHSKLYSESTKSNIGETWLQHLAFCERRLDEGKKAEETPAIERLLEAQITEDTLPEKLAGVGMGWAPLAVLTWSLITK